MRSDADIERDRNQEVEAVYEVDGGVPTTLDNDPDQLQKGQYIVAQRAMRNRDWIFIEGFGDDLKSARRYAREQVEPGTEVAILRVADTRTVGARVVRSLK